jgi:hypothetical protein
MKKIAMRISMILSMVAMVALIGGITSCSKTETTTPPVVVLDGYYVVGTATAYSGFSTNAMMKITRNEVTQTTDSVLYELYIPLKTGSVGFNIVKVAGSVQTVYGPGTGFGVVTTPTTDEPKYPFQRGPYTASSTLFTVPSDGLYHVVIYTTGMIAVVAPVHWGMIGAATPHGWTTDTMMTESAFSQTSAVWTLTGLKLMKGDWKFRYSHGWKIELDTNVDVGGGKKGVKVNTNFGGAVNALVPGGDNIVNAAMGIYTCTMTFTPGTGYVASVVKTGDVPPIDYSQYQLGIIGSCYLKQDGTQANWDENFGTMLPVVTGGTTYTWTYNIPINVAGDFKFRQGTDWSGKSIGYPDVNMAGAAAGNFSNDGGNFKVTITGNYTLVLQIDAATETYTVTATKN